MDKILSNLGLCNRARGLVSGTDIVIENLKKKKIYLIFLASDASENTKKMINDKAKYYGVPVEMEYTSEELSMALGQFNRMVIGITSAGFVKILRK